MEKDTKDFSSNVNDDSFIFWLYEEFKPIMFATAGKYVNNPSDREDIVQAALIKLIEKADVLREKNRNVLCAYVVYTIRNISINHLKHQRVVNDHLSNLDERYEEIPADGLPLDEIIAMRDRKVQLLNALKQIPDEDQRLLVGKYILDQTDHQLAVQFYCKPASIRMKLTRARRKVLKLMGMKEGEND